MTINATTGASATTLGSFDSIDGGAGNDTLNIYTDSTGPFNSVQRGTIKNVEIINVLNDAAPMISTTGAYAGILDAAKFEGATQVWQDTNAAIVANLADGVTAGFRNINAGVMTFATDAATSASIALDKFVEGNVIQVLADPIAAANGKLASVTISGNVVDGADLGSKVGPITEVITAGFDVQTVTLNTAVDATLVMFNEGGKAVSTLAAGSSAGGITHVGSADLATITTGAGKDDIALNAVYSATAKAASVTTGAGDDKITVNASNGADVVGTTLTVSAGDGKDTIVLATTHGATNAVATNVNAGAGDDTVSIQTVVATTDVIDGGDGNDTVEVAGQTTARIADDYIVLTKVLKNFEAVTFTTAEGAVATGVAAEVALDASKLASYKTITFDSTGVVAKLAADQTVVLNGGAVTATASGYISTDTGAATKVTSTTYAGTVNAEDVSGQILTAKADAVKLAVTAADTDAVGGQTNVASTLTGDVKSAVVTLTNGQDIAADGTVSHDNLASITIVANSGAAVSTLKGQEGAATALGAMTSLTLTGDGSANVTNTKGALATVDASGLGGTYTVTANGNTKGDATLGLTYGSTNANAETIKLGSGIDHITLGASTYGKVDSIDGLHLVLDNATTLAASSDTLVITGVNGGADASKAFTTTQTDLDLALKDAAAYSAAHTNVDLVFVQGGNTYVFRDGGTDAGLIDAGDTVVKLVGSVDLDALIVALH